MYLLVSILYKRKDDSRRNIIQKIETTIFIFLLKSLRVSSLLIPEIYHIIIIKYIWFSLYYIIFFFILFNILFHLRLLSLLHYNYFLYVFSHLQKMSFVLKKERRIDILL